jgi:hypothetical protein
MQAMGLNPQQQQVVTLVLQDPLVLSTILSIGAEMLEQRRAAQGGVPAAGPGGAPGAGVAGQLFGA